MIVVVAVASTVLALGSIAFLAVIGLWAVSVDEGGDSVVFVLVAIVASFFLIAAPVLMWTGLMFSGRSGRHAWLLAGFGVTIDAVLVMIWIGLVATA